MKILHFITFTLLLIGGLNWGLYGLMGWDVSVWLGGMSSQWAKILYLAVGVSAILTVVTHGKGCTWCGKKGMPNQPQM